MNRLIREGMYPLDDDLQNVTASIGVAGLDTAKRMSFSDLIKSAQKALGEAQAKGGNCARQST